MSAYLDMAEYAELLGVPRTWVRDKVAGRELRFHKFGKHVRFTPDDIEANAQAAQQQPMRPLTSVRVVARRQIRRSA